MYLGHARGPCSYLKNQKSSLLFLDGIQIGNIYRLLLDKGYRRHGFHVYRPDCSECFECHVLRIPVKDFNISRSQKRILKKGRQAFEIRIVEPEYSDVKLQLYKEYLNFQHSRESDTNSMSGYQEFFVDSFLDSNTRELQLYFKNKLCAIGIFDEIGDAVSAVYFYFSQSIAHLSPGTFNILVLIDWAKQNGLQYFYPGFYIPTCKAMNYKTNFGPYEIKRAGQAQWEKNSTPSLK